MDEHEQVARLLDRVADAAGRFAPPPLAELTGRRRSRLRAGAAMAGAAVAVTGLVVGLTLTAGGRRAETPVDRPTPPAPTVPTPTLATYRWSALPTAPIAVRGGAASAWTGTRLTVWGGQVPHGPLKNDGAQYDPATGRWTTLPPAPLSPRNYPQSAWVDGSFVVWGGLRSDGSSFTDGARLDPETHRWTVLPPAPVGPYSWARFVVAGGRAVLLSVPAKDQAVLRADSYDPTTDRWHRLPDLPARHHQQILDATAVSVGPAVYVWSEWQVNPAGSGVDAYVLRPGRDRWSVSRVRVDRGVAPDAAIWTGRAIVLGNVTTYCGACSHPMPGSYPAVAVDPHSGKRTAIPSGPLSKVPVDYFWTGAGLLAWNPTTEITGPVSIRPGDTAAWDQRSNRWTELTPAPLSGSAGGDVEVWTGTRLLIWGLTGGQPTGGLQFGPP